MCYVPFPPIHAYQFPLTQRLIRSYGTVNSGLGLLLVVEFQPSIVKDEVLEHLKP